MIYIKTILALIPLLTEVVNWIKELGVEDPAKFLGELHEAIKQTKTTKDPKAIQDVLRKL